MSNEGPQIGQHSPGYPELAHPEVCQLDVALGVQEDVLQLEVPMDDVVPVQEVDGEIQLSRIESVNTSKFYNSKCSQVPNGC